MTSQTRDFDADLDFDRVGMTDFFEAGVAAKTLMISSSFIGLNDMRFERSGVRRLLIMDEFPRA